MPKENINDEVTGDLRAVVSWRPDNGEGTGHVQLATVHRDSPATMPGEKTSEEDQPIPVNLDGWYVTLNREGLNRLIRVLRRARDSAYGPDA